MSSKFAASILLAAVGVPSHAQSPSPVIMQIGSAAFVNQLDTLVASLRGDFGDFGMSVAIIQDGRIVADRHYGFADAEKRIPMSNTTLVNVASVSKAVTALGVMRLVDRRRIELDAPVFDGIRRWKLPPSEHSQIGVTVARLLSHTAGISRHTTGTWTVEDKLPTLEAALSGDNGGYGDTRLIHEPGTKWSYSGGGYSILQLLVEETTGKTFANYMNSEVLPSLGIRSSWYGWGPKVNRATANYYDEFGKLVPAYRTIEQAAGAFNATAVDLARFALVFSKVRKGSSPSVLNPELMKRMMTPAPAGDLGDGLEFGLGLLLHRLPDGRTLISHDGGNPGSGAYFAVDAETGNGIAIVVNRSWAGQLFFPVACEWRNATAPAPAMHEKCDRDLTGKLVHTLAKKGAVAGKAQFDLLVAEFPERLGEPQILRMARQLLYAERNSAAAEVLRWHLEGNPQSAAANDRLGDVLLASGNSKGAIEAWKQSLAAKPEQPEVRQKIERASASS